jgi:acetyltransferase EpsM
MTRVIVIGGKGTAVVVAEQIEDARTRYAVPLELLGFAFDDPAYSPEINGFPVLCGTREVKERFMGDPDVRVVFQLYRSDKVAERARLRDSYEIPPERFYTFVHPSAFVARSARLGHGCVVCANSVVHSNTRLGGFNTVLSNVLISHDTHTGESCFFAGQACVGSNVTLGASVFIGLNASVKTGVRIGEEAVIGMASNVLSDVAARTIVAGNPARRLGERAGSVPLPGSK